MIPADSLALRRMADVLLKEAMGPTPQPPPQQPGKMEKYLPWYGAAAGGAAMHELGKRIVPKKYQMAGAIGGALLGTGIGVHGGEALGKRLDRPKVAEARPGFEKYKRMLAALEESKKRGDFIHYPHEKTAKVLTMKGRERIKEKNFAIPKGDGPGDTGKYPIHDTAHAKSALTFVERHGSPGEKAKVYSAVAKKYPGLSRESSVPALREKTKKAEAKEKMPPHPGATLGKSLLGFGLGTAGGYVAMKGLDALMRARGGAGLPRSGVMKAIPIVTGLGGLAYTQMQNKTLGKMRQDHLKRQEKKRVGQDS